MRERNEILDTPNTIDEVTQLRLQTYNRMERSGRVALGLITGLFLLRMIVDLIPDDHRSISWGFSYWYIIFDFLLRAGIYILMFILSFWRSRIAFAIGCAGFLVTVIQSYLSYLPPNWYLMATIQLLVLTLFGIGIYGAFKKAKLLSIFNQ